MKWLKKNRMDFLKLPFKGGTADVELDVVSVHALGEQLLEEHIDFQVLANTTKQKSNIKAYKVIAQVFKKLATDCLGRREVEKRLKQGASKNG